MLARLVGCGFAYPFSLPLIPYWSVVFRSGSSSREQTGNLSFHHGVHTTIQSRMEITSTAVPELPTISTRRKLRNVLLSTTCFRCSIGLESKGRALIKAASRSDVKKVKRLLECGADPNYVCVTSPPSPNLP